MKLKASSLLEVIVAGLILFIIFYLAMEGIDNVFNVREQRLRVFDNTRWKLIEYKINSNKIIRDTVVNGEITSYQIKIEEKKGRLYYFVKVYDSNGERIASKRIEKKKEYEKD